jgi:hypothetical protein
LSVGLTGCDDGGEDEGGFRVTGESRRQHLSPALPSMLFSHPAVPISVCLLDLQADGIERMTVEVGNVEVKTVPRDLPHLGISRTIINNKRCVA